MPNLKPFIYALLLLAPGAHATATVAPSKPAELHYLRGLLAEHSGALAQAQEELDQALKDDPTSAYLAREAAEVALELGDADKALQWAKVVEKAKPEDPDSYILVGRVLWARGQNEEAEASFEKALDLDPQSVESVLSLATLLGPSAPGRAKKMLEGFLEKNPDHAADAYLQIAKIDMQQNEPASARESLRKAIDIEPDESSLPARYALAQAYEVEHATAQALGEYLEIANLEPDNVSLLDHIGEIYLEQDNDAGAKASFGQAKRVQAADPASNRWLAAIAEKNNDFAQAAAFLRASAALPEEPTLNLQLSYYLTQAGHLKDAVDVLEKAHARWPANDQVAYFLALGYDDLKEEGKALALLRKVVAVKPDYHEARFQLGVILEKLNKMDEAETQFRALLADTPEDAAVLNYLGYSLADRGLKLSEAETYIAKAVDLDPRNGAYQDSLGWVHFKQGRLQDAVAELVKAATMLPEDDTVWEHVGDAQAAAGDPQSAWLSWKRSQSLASGPSTAASKAAKIQRHFSPEELGALYQDFFSYGQGGIDKLDGLCRLTGAVLGHAFSFQAMVHFKKAGSFSIEVLGPLFSPVASMSVGASGFSMDGLRIPGVPQDNVSAVAGQSLSLLRDYVSGAAFRLSPARWRRTFWRHRQSVRADALRIGLDPTGSLAAKLQPDGGAVRRLDLGEFGREQGHFLPKTLAVQGSGFQFSLDFTDAKAVLAPLAIPHSPAALTMKVQCPAKVNLFLEVTGRRPDGYHRLATLFAKINLYDVLDLSVTNSGRLELEIETEGAPPPPAAGTTNGSLSAGEDNLVMRAARAFAKAFGVGVGIKMVLTKRIPMGAGLGGGSSDAAGTLLGLAKLLEIRLGAKEKAKLHKIARSLGADVPFFLRPEPFCLGQGIGDRLTPVKIGKSLPYMLLIYPKVHIPTVDAYKALQKPSRTAVLTRLSQLDKLLRSLKKGRPIEEWQGLLFNRLEEARLPDLAVVEQARRILEQAGAAGVRMSGSGSSIFGFVPSHKEGEACLKRLQGYPWQVFLTSCQG